MNRKEKFPNDKRVTVIKADLTTYREWNSVNLSQVHGWTDAEIRVVQSFTVRID